MPDYMPPPSTLKAGASVWAYLRDSGGPAQEQSVPQQEAEIRAYCKRHGLALTRIFADVGKSGGSVTQRGQFLDMVDLTKDKPARPAGLLVWNFARFARDVDDSDYYKATLRRRGIVIHSLTDAIPEGPYAGVVEKIIDIANEEKRRQNSRDVKRALESLVSQGFAPGGTPPRGYLSERVTIGKHKDGRERFAPRWKPDPELFPLVQLAWKMRAEGKSYNEIGRATHGRLYRSRHCWITFFSNRSYLGIGKCGDKEFPNHHEAAITPELWEAVQRVQKLTPRGNLRHPRRVAFPSLLGGLAFCSECGAAMVHHAASRRNWPFYFCGRRDSQQARHVCNARRIGARKVDALVLDTVLNQILTLDFFYNLLEEVKKQMSDVETLQAQIEQKRAERRAVERAIQNLLDLAESFGAGASLERLKQREAERSQLSAEIKDIEARRDAASIEITPEALALVLDAWRTQIVQADAFGDVAAVRSLIARFVSKVELSYTTVKIWYTYPADSLIQPTGNALLGGIALTGAIMATPITLETMEL